MDALDQRSVRFVASLLDGALLTLALSVSCAADPIGPWVDTNAQRWPSGEVLSLESGVDLTLPQGVLAGTPKAERIAGAARAHLAAFRSDWPQARPVAPVEIGVTAADRIPCGNDARERYVGCWCTTPREDGATRTTLLVVAGEQLELPALYHELAHHALLEDGEHRDPRWPAIDARGAEVAARLR